MTAHTRSNITRSILVILTAALVAFASTAQAQTLVRRPSNVAAHPSVAARVAPQSAPAEQPAESQVTVELMGSFSRLTAGQATITGAGGVPLAQGALLQPLVVRSSAPVDVSVVVTGLVDRPTVAATGVALPVGGGAMTVPLSIETGLIRATATIGGRTVAGVVWLYRIDEATGAAATEACGSFGANTASREISTGRYLAVLHSGSTTLSRVVEITAGASRLAALEG
jgi:hypothetical protein